ncbi:Unknown protein, partial [Striga hermonthica]
VLRLTRMRTASHARLVLEALGLTCPYRTRAPVRAPSVAAIPLARACQRPSPMPTAPRHAPVHTAHSRAPARFAFLPAALRVSQPSPVLRSCTAHSRTPVHPPAARPRNPRKSRVHSFFAHLCASRADAHLSHFSSLLDSSVPNPTS